mgnify:FL=1
MSNNNQFHSQDNDGIQEPKPALNTAVEENIARDRIQFKEKLNTAIESGSLQAITKVLALQEMRDFNIKVVAEAGANEVDFEASLSNLLSGSDRLATEIGMYSMPVFMKMRELSLEKLEPGKIRIVMGSFIEEGGSRRSSKWVCAQLGEGMLYSLPTQQSLLESKHGQSDLVLQYVTTVCGMGSVNSLTGGESMGFYEPEEGIEFTDIIIDLDVISFSGFLDLDEMLDRINDKYGTSLVPNNNFILEFSQFTMEANRLQMDDSTRRNFFATYLALELVGVFNNTPYRANVSQATTGK